MAKVNLFDYVERRKKTGAITIDLGKTHGTVIMPPSELWADEVFDTASGGNTKAAVVMVLGEDGAQRFFAAGGNWRILHGIIREQAGVSLPESVASSES